MDFNTDKMKEYRSASPEFSDAIKVLGTDTPNHAEGVNVATRQLLDNTVALKNEMVCNLLYLPDAVNANSAGSASWQGGRFFCYIPSKDITVWSGEIALPEGGYTFPASSDTANVFVVYTLDGAENRVEISSGAVLPEGAVVTEYRLERKDGESRIVADILPMISSGKYAVTEYVPYTGDERKINRCVAFVIKSLEKLHKFCVEKFLTEDHIANNLVTTNAGYVLDARQGKILEDEINGINTGLSKTIKVRYIFKDSYLSAGSTYTEYYMQSPIGASEIVVFSMNGNILWFGYTLRNSAGYGMFRKIFGEAEVTVPANGPDGITHFYLDKDCNRMAVINI